ncbi:MAG: hypothetical protein AAFY33_18195 [Cyanobacteria bacterium J06643_4]
MANSSPASSSPNGDMDNTESAIKAALLQSVLDTEQSAPWLAAQSTDEYDAQVSTAGEALEFSDEEVSQGWQTLSAQLNQLWGGQSVGVVALLQQKFAGRMPSDLLAMIGEKAQQVAQSGQPMLDQLITCVQDGFDNMAAADLKVMARPMAFAMRGSSADEFVEATVQSIRKEDWTALSPIEQARLSLAAARYAISQSEDV